MVAADDAVAADEVRRVCRVDRNAAGGEPGDVQPHVGLFHETVAQHDAVDAVAEVNDTAARLGRYEGLVRNLDGEQDDVLV